MADKLLGLWVINNLLCIRNDSLLLLLHFPKGEFITYRLNVIETIGN